MTRGRESNTAHVVTGKTAPAGKKPHRQAAPESVLADVLQHDGDDLSATGQIRQAQTRLAGIEELVSGSDHPPADVMPHPATDAYPGRGL